MESSFFFFSTKELRPMFLKPKPYSRELPWNIIWKYLLQKYYDVAAWRAPTVDIKDVGSYT